MKKIAQLGVVLQLVAFAACGGNSGPAAPTTTRTLTSVAVTGNPITGTLNFQCTATATYSDAGTENVTNRASWSSSDPSVATVDSAGLVTGVTSGTVEIRATFQGVTGALTLRSAVNRNPVINSFTVSPTFGVSGVTSFLITASASDPDGDPVLYTWDFGDGSTGSGPAFSKTYTGSGVATIVLTVTDNKGGVTTGSRTATVGSMTGAWTGTLVTSTTLSFTASFTQSGAAVTGTMILAGFSGRTDPVQPGTINSRGAVVLRWKVAPFSDFTFTGQMDPTGRRVTGTVAGSGFNGQPFTMNKVSSAVDQITQGM